MYHMTNIILVETLWYLGNNDNGKFLSQGAHTLLLYNVFYIVFTFFVLQYILHIFFTQTLLKLPLLQYLYEFAL